MCFVLGVCERGSSTKTPTLGVFELEKGRDIGVFLCSVCVEHETTHVGLPPCSKRGAKHEHTHQRGVFMLCQFGLKMAGVVVVAN